MRTDLAPGRIHRAFDRDMPIRILLSPVKLWLAFVLLLGCGPAAPPATVDGTLRCNGQPLDNCLITFLPDPHQATAVSHSTGLTDQQGVYRLRCNEQDGAGVGWHRVTVQDLSISAQVVRRDHGTVDELMPETPPPRPPRAARVPPQYTSASRTPLRREIHAGHQTIDLDL